MASNHTSPVRRLLCLVLAAALCGAMTGCGPAAGPAATPTPEAVQSPAAPTPTPGEEVPAVTATTVPEATPTPSPSPTESGGEEQTPAPTPEATPVATPDTTPAAPTPSAPVSSATPTAKPTEKPAATPTPAPTEEPAPSPCNVPDATALEAAGWKAGDKVFTSGVTAEEFLAQVNETIAKWELIFADTYGTNGPCDQFNWHTQVIGLDGLTVLEQVKVEVLRAFDAIGTTTWTDLYKNFDIQVYYSQLIDLLGQPLPWGSPNYKGPAPTTTA